jgi:hypothetical protein
VAVAASLVALATGVANAQDARGARQRIDVQNYAIEAQIDPRAQTLAATARVRFTPIDDVSSVSFELNNALNLSKVTDEDGRQIPASRTQQDMSVRLNLPQTLQKGKVATLIFVYDGKLRATKSRLFSESSSRRFIPNTPTSCIPRAGSR